MDQQHLTIMATKFQSALDINTLNERGQHLAFAKRQRQLPPFRFGLSVIASMATQQVPSIASLHRDCNALWDMGSTYKAFYQQLAKASCAEFFRLSLCDVMGKLTRKVLGFEPGHAFGEFTRLVLQDGSSFALHDALADVFPGRFRAVKPAAVELHCTMDLLQDAPLTMVVSPDTDAEHDYRPAPETLKGDVFLADRGYLDLAYLRDIDRHGGSFIVRAKAGLNPQVIDAFREDGQRIKSGQGRDLKALVSKFPKQQRAACHVEWSKDHAPFALRLIVRWNPETQAFDYLLTNLEPSRYSLNTVGLGHKLRWQVALLFKEWKSHANLHAFATEKETIAEALIWASLVAATLKRFLTHAAEHVLEVVISTRKAAMSPAYVLPELFRSLCQGDGPWYRCAFKALIRYLGGNAKRAHANRDARTGRAQLGLKPVFELSDHKALRNSSGEPVAA